MGSRLTAKGAIAHAPDGIVPRETVVELASLAALRHRWEEEAEAVRALACDEAERIVAAAREEAAATAARAEADARRVSRLGYARGHREALDAWHEESGRMLAEQAARRAAWREDLAALVAEATARLVGESQGEAFYAAAIGQLDRLAEESRALTLRVHPDDLAAATAALASIGDPGKRWADGTTVKLFADPDLAPRSCLCESSLGCVDASLGQQIKALRRAAARAIAKAGDAGTSGTDAA